MTYVDEFLHNLMGPAERVAILAVRDRRTSGVEELTFNVTDVTLDFDKRTATVDDELDAAVSESTDLDDFFRRVESASVDG